MPSAKSIALSTFMRMLVKPSFAAMRDIVDLRSGAVKWFDRAVRLEQDMQISPAAQRHCEAGAAHAISVNRPRPSTLDFDAA